MLLMHERLAIKEKGWRGMYSCSDGVACRGVNTMIQGIACGTRLYYISGDKEDASHFDSHNRVSIANFGEYFVEIFQ